MPSRMFSGYLNVSETKHMHYIFVESEAFPSSDPVVIWLNGGPGCSSLDGFIYENGPFIINPKNYTQLQLRPIRWSQIANVLFLESPIGVGFSYSDIGGDDYNCTDDTAAADNTKAVELFFEKFPEYRSNDLFITGESYAGIYVPTLAESILKAVDAGTYSGAPLKGIAVGNGCSGHEIGICGFAAQGTYYLYKYLLGKAFIADNVKKSIDSRCDWPSIVRNNSIPADCQSLLDYAAKQIGHINLYNIYGDCVGSGDQFGESSRATYHSKAPHQSAFNLRGPDACIDSRAASGYFNQPSVMDALHVQAPSFTWAVCATPVGWKYTSTRPNLPRDTYPSLVTRIRVLIYNGDWDACVPYTDNEAWTEGMGYRAEQPWHPWTYTTPDGLDSQVGGYAVKYTIPHSESPDSWFRFITVRGGRHEVPESAPDKALAMLTRLVRDLPF